MKTPDEIKKGLECHVRGKYQNAYCGDCPYHANATQYLHECKAPEIITDTIAYIRQLERERDEVRKETRAIRAANAVLHDVLKKTQRERDALLTDLKEADMIDCSHCAHYSVQKKRQQMRRSRLRLFNLQSGLHLPGLHRHEQLEMEGDSE